MCERSCSGNTTNGTPKRESSVCAIGKKAPSLDKLAQLGTTHKSQRSKYQKKARAKVLTNTVTRKLLSANKPSKEAQDEDGNTYIKEGYRSPNTKAYLRTFVCSQYLYQDGHKVTSFYCKNRWCITCNRIRAANLITGYMPSLGELEDKQFVTLTVPNVIASELSQTIDKMYEAFVRVKGQLKKAHQRGKLPKFNGLRKLECTYNDKTKTFHPHFHLIVEGQDMANEVITRWLDQFPKASHKAQDIRKADEGSALELFKYFTKLFNDGKFNGEALDTIFVSIKGKRIFQNYGQVKKVSEDIPELISEKITFKGQRVEVWKWIDEAFDWISPDGETFSDYVPSDRIRELVEDSHQTQIHNVTTKEKRGKRSGTDTGSAKKVVDQGHQRTRTRKTFTHDQDQDNAPGMGYDTWGSKQPPDTT